jgi:hypothetical protein
VRWQEGELERLSHAREAEVVYLREQNELEVTKTRDLAQIETTKFKNIVDAIGSTTLQAIATAGPDMQVRRSILLSYPVGSLLTRLSFVGHVILPFEALTYGIVYNQNVLMLRLLLNFFPQHPPLLKPLVEPVPSLEMGRVASGRASGIKFLPQHSSY